MVLGTKDCAMIRAGVSVVDITPDPGLLMSGFAARTEPAKGAHDALSVRVLAVDETALLVADVIGFHQDMSARIRARCCLPDQNVVISATHTHGGPVSMEGRLHATADADYLRRLEDASVSAIDQAVLAQVPANLTYAEGADPDVARNRRHAAGPIDRPLPILRVYRQDGHLMAILVNYACHPVVLGADNRLWTGDYPHFVRAELEQDCPDATAIFLTGCIGDLNTGHSASASISLAANPARSFSTAAAIGKRIAHSVMAAEDTRLGTASTAAEATVAMRFERRENEPAGELRQRWLKEARHADDVRSVLLQIWADWAQNIAPQPLAPLSERVSVLNWGGMTVIGLPGEIFAATAHELRAGLGGSPLMLAGFCEDNPGYIPPAIEYQYGGYEVDEAHRYYGQGATVAPSTAEALRDAALDLARAL